MKKFFLCLILFFEAHALPPEFHGHTFTKLAIWVNRPTVAYPFVGHTWLELVDKKGGILSYEHHSRGMKRNKAIRRPRAVSYTWTIEEHQAEEIIEEMEQRIAKNDPYDLFHNNCVHLVKKAMNLAGIPHPDFCSESFVPTPARVYHYLTLLNKGLTPQQIAQKYLNHPQDITPVGSKKSLQDLLQE